MTEVRRIRAGEARQLKTLRLRALADSPEAFGSTLEEAMGRSDEDWSRRAERDARSETSTIVVACDGEDWYGMAGGYMEPGQTESVTFISLWVDPARRRAGTGTALVNAVAQWARGRGLKRMDLWVTETNAPAISLYERFGFIKTGQTQPYPSNPALHELQMVLDF